MRIVQNESVHKSITK